MCHKNGVVAAILLMLLSFGKPAHAGSVGFRAVTTFPVGTAPRAVAVADFDGDSRLDLAVANSGNPSVGDDGGITLFMGGFLGSFRFVTTLRAGKNPQSIATGDFNGDGKLDLVVANPGDTTTGTTGTITILLGNGDLTFLPAVALPVDFSPVVVLVGDFNGDLKPDLAVASASGSFTGIAVFLGNGDGSFQTAVKSNTTSPPNSLALADFNSDGKSDLTVAGRINMLDILLGNGDGTFQVIPPSQSLGLFISQVVTSDFNLDHKPDVAVFRAGICFSPPCGSPSLGLLLGNGDGTLQNAVTVGSGNAAIVDDFDGDGKPDLALYEPSGTVEVLLGNGDGTFQAAQSFAAVSGSTAMALGDFDHDKAPDLVLVNTGNNSVSVMPNRGTDFSISASPPTPNPVTAGQSATSTITISLLNGFNNPVSISCSLPQNSTISAKCSLNRTSVGFDQNGNGTATLTVNVPSAVASLSRGYPSWQFSGTVIWMPIAGIAMLGRRRRSRPSQRRRHVASLLGLLLIVLFSAGLLFQAGCGGGGTSKPATATSISVNVQASTGFVTHSTTIVVNEN